MDKNKLSYEEFWKLIQKNEGLTIYTKTGIPFSYHIRTNSILVDGTDWLLGPKMLRYAYDIWPIDGPSGFGNRIVQRSSHVWGIFNAATKN
ncbi:hypothetical protein [Methanoregula sp.]|uniref:hypothetical protein n=1 Tax=Methanoregula sp. TaxID=2052170 RepID=UPI003BB069AD